MRVVIVGLLGLLLFFLIWPFFQLALLGPELAGNTLPPRLSLVYLRWLLALFFALVTTGLILRKMWRLMTR